MKPFINCPVCSNDIVEKEVEKILRGGKNTAIIKVKAEVAIIVGNDCILRNKYVNLR